MVAFAERPLCYQVGLLLLLVSTAVMAAGMLLPWWAQTHSKTTHAVTRHSGLWLGCSTSPEEQCSPIDAPDWFKAVQGLQCVSLMGMVVGCVYAVFTNCCLDHATFSRVIELSAGTGGLLGIVSCMLYVAKTSHILRQSHDISYSWAFGMDVAACVFATFIAAVIALGNNRQPHEEASIIMEDGSNHRSGGRWKSMSRSRSRSRSRAEDGRTRVEVEMERSPARTARLGGTSDRDTEVIVLHNDYTTDSVRPAVHGAETGPANTTSPRAACVCTPHWTHAVTGLPGRRAEGGQSVSGAHAHCFEMQCYTPLPSRAAHVTTNGPYTSLPSEGSPTAASASNKCSTENPHHDSLPPPYSFLGQCPGYPASGTSCQPHWWGGAGEETADRASTVPDDLPRAVASAPPLQAEHGDPFPFSAVQYFVGSQTVCVGDGPRREQ